MTIRERWIATRDVNMTSSRRGVVRAGAIFDVYEGGLNAVFQADHWVNPPPGDLPVVGWDPDNTEWWVELGLVRFYPSPEDA